MTISLGDLCKAFGWDDLADLGHFKPGAFYHSSMDQLFYLSEDVSYRSEQLIPGVVEVLWHPDEDRVVGIKIWDVSQHEAGRRILKRGKFTEQ